MKREVLLNDLELPDIISANIRDEFLELLCEDIKEYFVEGPPLVDVSCPGCGRLDNDEYCVKLGLRFLICLDCGSRYVSPRPPRGLLDEFHENSRACKYWRKETLELPAEKVRYIYETRINWVTELVTEHLSGQSVMLDIGTKYPALLNSLCESGIVASLLTLDPCLFESSSLLTTDVTLVQDASLYSGEVDIVTAFETLERAFDIGVILRLASESCKDGGFLLITTASCSGFEYQVLGKNAPNINPVNRMNLLSLEALVDRVQNVGFQVVELSTPGRLDCEIVRSEIARDGMLPVDPFWRYVLEFRGERPWQELQTFLQMNHLSSHVKIVARKQ